jgi:hypothetical protein
MQFPLYIRIDRIILTYKKPGQVKELCKISTFGNEENKNSNENKIIFRIARTLLTMPGDELVTFAMKS